MTFGTFQYRLCYRGGGGRGEKGGKEMHFRTFPN